MINIDNIIFFVCVQQTKLRKIFQSPRDLEFFFKKMKKFYQYLLVTGALGQRFTIHKFIQKKKIFFAEIHMATFFFDKLTAAG